MEKLLLVFRVQTILILLVDLLLFFILLLLVLLLLLLLILTLLLINLLLNLLLMSHCLLEEFAYSFAEKVFFKNFFDVGSLSRVFVQHFCQEIPDVVRVVSWDGRIVLLQNLQHQSLHAIGVKSVIQSQHFIQNASQTPNVTLLIIGFLLADLRREVVRSANGSLRFVVSVLEHSGNAKVSNLDLVLAGQEDVLRLQISVQYSSVVHMLDGQTDLHEPVQHLLF